MSLPDLSVYFTELLICVLLILAVRTLGGRLLGPGARRLLWTLLIVKALVPFTLPTAYHPIRMLTYYENVVTHNRHFDRSEAQGEISPLLENAFSKNLSVEPQTTGEISRTARNDGTLYMLLFTVWLVGFLMLIAVAVWRNRTLIGRATKNPVAVPDWVQTIFLDCRESLQLAAWPVLIVSPYVPTPCLVGAVRPRILIPESLIEQRSEESEKRIRFLLLHELVHLKQGDIWLAWLWTLTLAVHWFNPLFWILGRFLKFDCETACDDRVLTILEQKERRDYGRSLVDMMIELHPCRTNPGVTRVRSTPGSLCVVETRSNLERRLTMMKFHRTPTLLRSLTACIVFLVLGAFCLTSYAEPKPPISADKAKWMGYVEDFFMNNYRDITMRKSLAWGDPKTDEKGNVSITYKYDALIWGKENVVIEDQFTFDKTGKFVDVKKLSKEVVAKKEEAVPKNMTQPVLKSWVERFFSENFRDITSRKTLKWGDMKTNDDGTFSIDYQYEATIWNKDKKVIEQRFTFDKTGKYVGHETLESGASATEEKPKTGKTDAAATDSLPDNLMALAAYDKPLDRVPEWFLERDKDKDGRLSLEDYANGKPVTEKIKEEFQTLDINKDGVVTAEEVKSFLKELAKKSDAAASRKKAQEGWQCFLQGNSQDGEPLFVAATELDPKNANAWQGLGWTQWARGKGAEAKKAFETCLTLDKRNVAAINGLGQIAHSEGETDKAIEYWTEGTKVDPRASGPMAALASVYDGKDDYPNAIKYYEMWLRVEPNNDDAKAALKKVKEKAAKK